MSAEAHLMVSKLSEGISKDGIFWTYSYSSLAKERWLDLTASTLRRVRFVFQQYQFCVLFGRTGQVNAGLVPDVTPRATRSHASAAPPVPGDRSEQPPSLWLPD